MKQGYQFVFVSKVRINFESFIFKFLDSSQSSDLQLLFADEPLYQFYTDSITQVSCARIIRNKRNYNFYFKCVDTFSKMIIEF